MTNRWEERLEEDVRFICLMNRNPFQNAIEDVEQPQEDIFEGKNVVM